MKSYFEANSPLGLQLSKQFMIARKGGAESKVFNNQIVLVDRAHALPKNSDPSQAILISAGLSAEDLLVQTLQSRIPHIIQTSLPIVERDLAAEIAISAALIEQPQDFFSNPLKALLPQVQAKIFSREIIGAHSKSSTLEEVLVFLKQIPGSATVRDHLIRIADELYMNAIFSAPVDSSGNPKYRDCDRTKEVQLEKHEQGMLQIGFDAQSVVLVCIDPFGSLDTNRLLSSIEQIYKKGVIASMRSEPGGAGIGFHAVYDLTPSLYLGVSPKRKTAICCKFPLGMSYRELEGTPKSLHLIHSTDPA